MKHITWNMQHRTYNQKLSAIAVFLLFVSCFMFHVSLTRAQFTLPTSQLPDLNLKPTLSLTLNPATPLPNSIVVVNTNVSGITGANNLNYAWFLNGVSQKAASGLNKNIFTFQVGNLGTAYKVSVNISIPNGNNLSDSISLTVSDFDLTWDASSQAPASYRGKLLPTQDSLVGVSALPFIYRSGTKTLISNNNLIFNWTMDDKFQTANSGAGRSDFLFRASDYAGSNKDIRLEIKTSDGAVSLSKNIIVPIIKPQALIYFNDPETNFPYGAALKNLIAKPMNLNFIAQNYFFNAGAKDLEWQWLVDDKEATGGGGQPWLASLNLSDISAPFYTQIQATVKNPKNDLEMAQSTINLEVK